MRPNFAIVRSTRAFKRWVIPDIGRDRERGPAFFGDPPCRLLAGRRVTVRNDEASRLRAP